MPRAEKINRCAVPVQVHEKHYTARTLAEDKATSLEECWPFKEDAVLESTVGRLGSRVRVAEGWHGCVCFSGIFKRRFLEFWALSKDPGLLHPRQGPILAAVARWPRRPATRYSRSSASSGVHAGLCCVGVGIFTVLVVGVLVLCLLLPSFVWRDSKQASTTYQP